MADAEEQEPYRFCEGKSVAEMLAPATPRHVVVGPVPWMAAYCSLDEGELQHRAASVAAHADGFGLWMGMLALTRAAFSRTYDLRGEPTREHNVAVFRLDLLGLAGGNLKPALDAALAGYYNTCFMLERTMLETWRRSAYARLHPQDVWRWLPQDRWPDGVLPVSDTLSTEQGGMPTNAPRADRIGNVISDLGDDEDRGFLAIVGRGFGYLSGHSHPTLEGATQTWDPHGTERRYFGPTYSEPHAIRCLRWGLLAGGMLLREVNLLAAQGDTWVAAFSDVMDQAARWGRENAGGRFEAEGGEAAPNGDPATETGEARDDS